MDIQRDIPLADFTTIGLGGTARFFAQCKTVEDIKEALQFAQKENVPVHILGGGSNTIFSDQGFNGLILQVKLRGTVFQDEKDHTLLTAAAGEQWDKVVSHAIDRGLAGIECLSGIPGLIGAAPIQNIGAYGQEIAETLQLVHVLHRNTFEEKDMTLAECQFGYRSSIFKQHQDNPYIVLGMTLALRQDGVPAIAYEQLQEVVPDDIGVGKEALRQVRDAVLELRKKKSMLIDESDPNTKSCGSFFVNPVVTDEKMNELISNIGNDIPHFSVPDGNKLSAAWLIEQAGFTKGYREGGVGLSSNHTLALVNYDGSTQELLGLANTIQSRVKEKFGIELVREPVAIPYEYPVQ